MIDMRRMPAEIVCCPLLVGQLLTALLPS